MLVLLCGLVGVIGLFFGDFDWVVVWFLVVVG